MNNKESKEIFSFVISSDFASFRKFDTADTLYLTYYFIPRPVVLGIIGAIMGLKKSTSATLPWWEKLKTVKIAVEPLEISSLKHLVIYNNSTGAASYSEEKGLRSGQNLVVREQILINPRYRIYVELNDITKDAFDLLTKNKTVFTPYMGKNEFMAKITEIEKHKIERFEGICRVSSIYPSYLAGLSNRHTNYWIEGLDLVEILESYPYDYDDQYKYIQDVFIFSNREIDTRTLGNTCGCFVKLKNGKVIYLIGGRGNETSLG
ncbi:MAG: type I-B CRISPR-associated protein Cas5b [Candidatus Micrarchaeia archaeon]